MAGAGSSRGRRERWPPVLCVYLGGEEDGQEARVWLRKQRPASSGVQDIKMATSSHQGGRPPPHPRGMGRPCDLVWLAERSGRDAGTGPREALLALRWPSWQCRGRHVQTRAPASWRVRPGLQPGSLRVACHHSLRPVTVAGHVVPEEASRGTASLSPTTLLAHRAKDKTSGGGFKSL